MNQKGCWDKADRKDSQGQRYNSKYVRIMNAEKFCPWEVYKDMPGDNYGKGNWNKDEDLHSQEKSSGDILMLILICNYFIN